MVRHEFVHKLGFHPWINWLSLSFSYACEDRVGIDLISETEPSYLLDALFQLNSVSGAYLMMK